MESTKTLTTILLSLALATALAPATLGGGQPPGPCGERQVGLPTPTDPRCVDPPPSGAECVAFGILLVVDDPAAGKTVISSSESRARTEPQGSPYALTTFPATHGLTPPADPVAHADAEQAGFSYDNGVISVSASEVFSRCDVGAGFDDAAGYGTEAFGRTVLSELEVGLFGVPQLTVEALEYELGAQGTAAATNAWSSCKALQSEDPVPGPHAVCFARASVITGPPALTALHHSYGPIFTGAGWGYGGAFLHVEITGGGATADLYIGYVGVGVWGGPPSAPIDHFHL